MKFLQELFRRTTVLPKPEWMCVVRIVGGRRLGGHW